MPKDPAFDRRRNKEMPRLKKEFEEWMVDAFEAHIRDGWSPGIFPARHGICAHNWYNVLKEPRMRKIADSAVKRKRRWM